MTKEYQLDICLKELSEWKNTFLESYKIALREDFVTNNSPKEHNFLNHVTSFLMMLKRNSYPLVKKPFKKREIVVVSFWLNVGSEVSFERPCLIYKDSKSTLWEDVIVIPLTTATIDKKQDAFDVYVPKDTKNCLYANSWARLRQLRSVSIKRLGKVVWIIEDDKVKEAINTRVKEMLWTEA